MKRFRSKREALAALNEDPSTPVEWPWDADEDTKPICETREARAVRDRQGRLVVWLREERISVIFHKEE